MKTEYDEKALLERARAGDQDAFAALVKLSERTVYNLAYRMCGNEEDALDVSQEAYLRAWRSLKTFEGTCSFSSWMYTVTRNACIDFLKKEQKNKTVPISGEDADGDEREIRISSGTDDEPDKIYEKKERRERVRAAIAQLPELTREVLVLYDIEGYSYADIARMLCIEQGTVKSRLWRAREKLRKILSEDGTFLYGGQSNE